MIPNISLQILEPRTVMGPQADTQMDLARLILEDPCSKRALKGPLGLKKNSGIFH